MPLVPVAIVSGAATVADIATDLVGGSTFQRVKLDIGASGASTPVVGVLPVVVSGGQVAIAGAVFASAQVSVIGNVAASVGGTVLVNDVTLGSAAVTAGGGRGVLVMGVDTASVQQYFRTDDTGRMVIAISAGNPTVTSVAGTVLVALSAGNVIASVQGNVAASVAGHVLASVEGTHLVSGAGTFLVALSAGNVIASVQGNVAASVAGHVLVSADGHALVSGDGSFIVVGNAASDAADAGNPVKIGGIVVVSANAASAAAADRVNAAFDKVGRQIVVNQQPRELVVQAFVTCESANRTMLASGGAGIFNDLTHLSITNAAATAVTVYVFQGSAGTPVLTYNLAAGGGVVNYFQPPWKQTVTDKVWSLQSTSAGSGFLYVNVQAVQNT